MKEAELDKLNKEILSCTKCPIYKLTSNRVHGYGDINSPLLVVAEAPAQTEVELGIPLTGKTGSYFIDCMKEVGLSRKFVYTTNAVLCRPCEKVSYGLRNLTPSEEEIKNCKPYLDKLVEIMKPKLILSVGAVAAQLIIGDKVRITIERGTVRDSIYGIPSILTVHPSFITRQEQSIELMWKNLLKEDLKFAIRKAKELSQNTGE